MPINYNHYPPNWKEMRDRILDRDAHSCQHCGVKNYSVGVRDRKTKKLKVWYVGKDYQDSKLFREAKEKLYQEHPIIIILTVAHLDHDEWNHDVSDDRLASLCQRCHLQYDREDNNKRKEYGKFFRRDQLEIF